jgi:cytochrome c oxidase subunit 2
MSEHPSHASPVLSPQDDMAANGEGMAMPHVDFYERIWMRVSAAILVVFFVAVTISAFSAGFQVPGMHHRIDPTKLYEAGSPFADPVLREVAHGQYEVYIRAQFWQFTPSEIRIPAGSKLTFYVTSQDVQHGFKILGTNINMMLLPGHISMLTTRFDKPGIYNFVCHEYCGLAHHTMYGKVIVEAPGEPETARSATEIRSN